MKMGKWIKISEMLWILISKKLQIIVRELAITDVLPNYRNLRFGLTTKARACEGVSQIWSLGVTFHAPKSARECEGMNPHTPKWTPILGIGVLADSRIFRSNCRGQNPLDWRNLYNINKLLEHRCLKWARMTHLNT